MNPLHTDNITQYASPILVVDDSPAATHAMERLLQDEAFSAVSFERGMAALAYARTNPVRGAIVDVHMPDLSGLVLTSELRRLLGPAAPIIVVSGDSSMETLNSLTVAGATWFYQKPVSGRQLINRLRILLGTKSFLSEADLAEDPGHSALNRAQDPLSTSNAADVSAQDQAQHLREDARRAQF